MGFLTLLNGTWLKAILIVLVIGALVFGGWEIRGWHDDSVYAQQQEKLQAVKDANQALANQAASTLEQMLQANKTKATNTRTVLQKETQKVVYSTQCIDASGVALINQMGKGQ